MAWARNRALLIGAGAVLVVAVAAGVAAAHAVRHHRRVQIFIGRAYLGGPMARGPFGGGSPRGEMGRGWFGPGPMTGPMMGGPRSGGLGMLGALHGELTVPAPNGKYETVDVQRGTVTSLSPRSITVRSADGFTKTYGVSGSAARGVAKGDLVMLRASVSGGNATVVTLLDLSNARVAGGPAYSAP